MGPDHTLCVPIKLDAFVFNQSVCDHAAADKAKIAPITQPNYTFLRVTESLALNDVLPHVDLHNAAPATRNSRYTDIGTGRARSERVGVYLHWMIPRPFRRGVASSTPSQPVGERPQAAGPEKDETAPVFYPIPNRWLVVRTLDPNASTTQPRGTSIKPVRAWLIESDRTQYIDDIDDGVDLQVGLSPFITAFANISNPEKIKIDKQAEVFIGQCIDLDNEKKPWDEPGSKGRVELTATSSSNQLFLDYQYHNGNVFSMLDTFEYDDHGRKHLQAAEASYYVVGWQSDEKKDIMSMPDPDPSVAKPPTRRSKLDALALQLNEELPDAKSIADWLDSADSTRSICHGSLYQVRWNSDEPPKRSLSDEFAAKMQASMPLAIGTSPLDAILTYVSSHTKERTIEDSIRRLQGLLRADDETVDAQRAAEVENEAFNFADFDGGFQYDLPDNAKDNTYREPSADEKKAMMLLNAERHLYDSITRQFQAVQWDLFSVWWKYVSDSNPNNRGDYGRDAKDANDLYEILRQLGGQVFAEIKKATQPKKGSTERTVKQATMEPFHQQNDPTLMMAGLRPGWPRDFNEKLTARLDHQIVPAVSTSSSGDLADRLEKIKIPTTLKPAALKLAHEFNALMSSQDPDEKAPKGSIFPVYHDRQYAASVPGDDDNPWRDRWSGRQPWFPLYLEWEAEYFHIPFDLWNFGDFQKVYRKPDPSRAAVSAEPEQPDVQKTGYFVAKELKQNLARIDEPRSLSGRMLILPQPTFSLKVHIERLFSTIPPSELDKVLPAGDRKTLKNSLDRLEFLSAPMAGFTNHLLTRYEGTHVKPLVRIPGLQPIALEDAARAIGNLGLDVALIDKESDPTPYGSLISLVGAKDLAFKPASHGQFRFTKLNVVDKFGQVVHAIDPLTDATSPIHPSISYYYKPQEVSAENKTPNVVDPRASGSPSIEKTEFIQIPLCINQPARWNADFVVHDTSDLGGRWRPTNRWENPIWGWVVVNYVDRGLQFFTSKGTFFREVRLTEGENSSAEWLPFPAPSAKDELDNSAQLLQLVERVRADQEYLKGMIFMINAAIENSAPAPAAYGQFLNSLVGKPLALTNMGWSLELSTNSRQNQSTLEDQKNKAQSGNRAFGLLPDEAKNRYTFSLKIGDSVQSHDGMVGFFMTKDQTDPGYDDLYLDTIYTHYTDKRYANLAPVSKTPLSNKTSGYPKFHATWVDPSKLPHASSASEKAVEYERQRNKNIHAFGLIIDPFQPVHGYSGILPLKRLSLPSWTWEDAIKKLTTFFHAGPVLVTKSLPAFNAKKILTRTDQLDSLVLADKEGLALPALQVADWAWLQPYQQSNANAEEGKDEGSQIMPLSITKADTIATLSQGPYTATDGYMVLKAPVERPIAPQDAGLVSGLDSDDGFEVL